MTVFLIKQKKRASVCWTGIRRVLTFSCCFVLHRPLYSGQTLISDMDAVPPRAATSPPKAEFVNKSLTKLLTEG